MTHTTGRWFYLSFCDGARPAGQQFLGACIVGPAVDIAHAIQLAWVRKCNPGGEVKIVEIPAHLEPKVPQSYRGRLLNRREAEGLGAAMSIN